MAFESFHNVTNRWFATLDGAINNSTTSVVIDDTGAGNEPDVPFYVAVGDEAMKVTAVAADTPSAGHSTLTVERGVFGTTATSHNDNTGIYQPIFAAQITEVQRVARAANAALVYMLGGDGIDGVVLVTDGGTSYAVQAQGSPDMTVVYKAGVASVEGNIVASLEDANSGTFTAPTTNPRIDTVQISTLGVISVKTGTEAGSPSAPTVDSGNLKLAEIYHRVGSTSIKDTDDSTNSYITDSRVFV